MSTYISEKNYKELLKKLEKEFPDFRRSFLEEEILVGGKLKSVMADNIIPEEIMRKIVEILNDEN